MLVSARVWLVPVFAIALLASAAPARANQFTVDFLGAIDLSSVGGAASNTFSGSFTWDPAAAADAAGIGFAQYTPVAASLKVNSTDLSIAFPLVNVGDNFPVVNDFFEISLNDICCVLLSGGNSLVGFAGDVYGPASMFSSTALPGDLDFLGSVTSGASLGVTLHDVDGNEVSVRSFGSFTETAHSEVPEPSSLKLAGFLLPLVAFASMRRRWRHA